MGGGGVLPYMGYTGSAAVKGMVLVLQAVYLRVGYINQRVWV